MQGRRGFVLPTVMFALAMMGTPRRRGGGGDLFGAIVGSTITASGGSRLHYDEALAQQPSNLLTAITGSWAQLGVK